MDKLSNYIKDFDNIVSVINDDEYKYCNVKPITAPQLLKETDTPNQTQKFLVRIKTDDMVTPNYIELASNLDIKHMVTTDTVTGFVTTSGEFFMLYDGIQYFEKITNNIHYAIAGENVFCLVTDKNIPIFVSTCNGQVIDDDYWLTKKIKTVYNIKNKFFFVTDCNCLYIFDGCVKMGFTFEEINFQVQDVALTLDTITVLTIHGKVWLFGDKEHGAYVTDGRGFIPGINSAKQIVRTVRAGAILTSDNSVWAWGSVLYGGSPRPGWVQGLKDNCRRLLSTSTSIIAITLANQLWAWSNEWFKTYSLPESEFAVASCINKTFNHFVSIKENKTSWIVQTREGQYFIVGKGMKQLRVPKGKAVVVGIDYGWLILVDDIGLLYTDVGIEKMTNILYMYKSGNKLLVQSHDKVSMYTINHLGRAQTVVNKIEGNIVYTFSSDKCGFLYITDTSKVYNNTNMIYRNIDSQFSVGVINHKEIVLYIKYVLEDKKSVTIQDTPVTITKKPIVIVHPSLGTSHRAGSPSPPGTPSIVHKSPSKTTPRRPAKTPKRPTTPRKPTLSRRPVTPAKTVSRRPVTPARVGQKTTNIVQTTKSTTKTKTPLVQIQPLPADMGDTVSPIIVVDPIQFMTPPPTLPPTTPAKTLQQAITPAIESVKSLFALDFIQANIQITVMSLFMFIIILFLILFMIIKIIK